MKRTLRLRKDTLTELSADELRDLAGATWTPMEYRIPTRERCSDSYLRDCSLSYVGTYCLPTTTG